MVKVASRFILLSTIIITHSNETLLIQRVMIIQSGYVVSISTMTSKAPSSIMTPSLELSA
jgi:hypothetical protein